MADDVIAETNPVGYEVRRTGLGRYARAVSAHAVVLTERDEPRPDDVFIAVEISDGDGTTSFLITRGMMAHLLATGQKAMTEAGRLVEELT